MEVTTIDMLVTNATGASDIYVNTFYANFLPLFCFVTCIANLATILAFVKEPNLTERPSEALILSLSCADLGTGLLALPANSLSYIFPRNWPLGEAGCRVEVFFFDLTVHSSLLTVFSISLDRFLLVYLEYPQYLKHQSHGRIRKTILTCWGIAILTAILEMSLWNLAKRLDQTASKIDFSQQCLSPPRRMKAFAITLITVLYFVPILVMCGLSLAFLYLLRKRLIKHRVTKISTSQTATRETELKPNARVTELQSNDSIMTTSFGAQSAQNATKKKIQMKNRYVRPAVTLFALISAMTICMLPYCTYVIIIDGLCQSCTYNRSLFNILLFLQYSNALLDPFLYALTQRKIRKYFKNVLYSVKMQLCSCTCGHQN